MDKTQAKYIADELLSEWHSEAKCEVPLGIIY